jgi:hypothetical protein
VPRFGSTAPWRFLFTDLTGRHLGVFPKHSKSPYSEENPSADKSPLYPGRPPRAHPGPSQWTVPPDVSVGVSVQRRLTDTKGRCDLAQLPAAIYQCCVNRVSARMPTDRACVSHYFLLILTDVRLPVSCLIQVRIQMDDMSLIQD